MNPMSVNVLVVIYQEWWVFCVLLSLPVAM